MSDKNDVIDDRAMFVIAMMKLATVVEGNVITSSNLSTHSAGRFTIKAVYTVISGNGKTVSKRGKMCRNERLLDCGKHQKDQAQLQFTMTPIRATRRTSK